MVTLLVAHWRVLEAKEMAEHDIGEHRATIQCKMRSNAAYWLARSLFTKLPEGILLSHPAGQVN